MGLEAGLFKAGTAACGTRQLWPHNSCLAQVFTSKEGEGKGGLSRTEQAKQLLTQYGSAYLVTSITFAAISFALCYFAVDAGACMPARLQQPVQARCMHGWQYLLQRVARAA
jgi:hypothetical protein